MPKIKSRKKREPKFAKVDEEVKKALEAMETPEQLFRHSRVAAIKVMHICAPALRALTPVFTTKVPTLATDKYFRCYVNPDMLTRMVLEARAVSKEKPCGTCGAEEHIDTAYIAGAICHEAWHPLRDHYNRYEEACFTNSGKWNRAGDCEINDDLVEIFKCEATPHICLPEWAVFYQKYNLEANQLAETYYMEMPDEARDFQYMIQLGDPGEDGEGQSGDGDGDNPPWDCGSVCDGKGRSWDEAEPGKEGSSPGVTDAEAGMIRKDVAKRIEKAQKTQGNVPAGMNRWAEDYLEPPKYDWKSELQQACRFSMGRTYGEQLRNMQRLGRRCASLNFRAILPSTHNPVPRVAIVSDTSGSMDQNAINEGARESEAIFKGANAKINFYSVDAASSEAQQVSSISEVQFTGGGGTDMRVGINKALDHYETPNVIVVFTDGFTPWPEQGLADGNCKLIICLVGESVCEISDCPAYAMTIRIAPEEVTVQQAS